jgi:hypothetical protein
LLRPFALLAIILGVAFGTDHKYQSQIKIMSRQIEASVSFTLLVGIALGILACLALHLYRPSKTEPQRNYWKPSHLRAHSAARQEDTLKSKSADFEIHRAFSNVFALMSVERRQALIGYYQKKFDCGASEAMQIAIEDFKKESQRYG